MSCSILPLTHIAIHLHLGILACQKCNWLEWYLLLQFNFKYWAMLFCFPTERDTETKEVRYVTDTMCRLEGHSNRITGLSWSFHREAQIVSASYDGSAQVCSVFVTILKSTYFNSWLANTFQSLYHHSNPQVWDVKNVQPMANYRGHSGRLFCTQWSMTDPDVIYTGADDFSVHAWRISQQEYIVPPKGQLVKKVS